MPSTAVRVALAVRATATTADSNNNSSSSSSSSSSSRRATESRRNRVSCPTRNNNSSNNSNNSSRSFWTARRRRRAWKRRRCRSTRTTPTSPSTQVLAATATRRWNTRKPHGFGFLFRRRSGDRRAERQRRPASVHVHHVGTASGQLFAGQPTSGTARALRLPAHLLLRAGPRRGPAHRPSHSRYGHFGCVNLLKKPFSDSNLAIRDESMASVNKWLTRWN